MICRAPLANLGLFGKKWDYEMTSCLKLGLQKSALKLGLWISNSTKFGFSIQSKLGLWDFILFEIGITGLRRFWNWDYGITSTGLPVWGPYLCIKVEVTFFLYSRITWAALKLCCWEWMVRQEVQMILILYGLHRILIMITKLPWQIQMSTINLRWWIILGAK